MLGEERDGTDSDILFNNDAYVFGKPKKKKNRKHKEKIKENSNEFDDIEIKQDNTIEEERRYKKGSISCPNCKSLRQKIKEIEQVNRELIKIKDMLSKENNELINNNSELLKKTDSLNNQISELNNKINKLTTINSSLDNQIFQLNNEKNDLIAQINNLKQKLNSINTNSSYNFNNSTNSFRLLRNNNIDENKTNENKNEIEELKKRLLDLESWKKTIDEKNKSYSEKITFIENNLKILNEKKQESNSEEESEEEFESPDPPKLQNKRTANNTDNYNNDNYNTSLSKSQNLYQTRETKKIRQNNLSYDNNTNINKEKNNINPKRKTSTDFSNNYQKKENPKRFNSKIITEIDELNLIAKGLVKENMENLKKLKVGYKLIYRASDDGDDAETFHQKCDGISGTLTIIKTKDDWIFGGYTSVTWDTESEDEKKDLNSFVFSINLEKIYYASEQKEYCIYCDSNKGPSFIGMFSLEESMLNMANKVNPWGVQCYNGESLPCEINGGKKEFYIEEVEVFQVIMKKIIEK